MQYFNSPQPFYTQQQYEADLYKRSLKKTANGLGALLLVFFGLEIVIAVIADVVLLLTGTVDKLLETDMLYLLENGMIFSLIFFVTGLIYCRIRRLNLGAVFPFQKIEGGMLARLCTVGIAFSLMSNYVVSLVNNTFGLFGLENNGGSFDTGSAPSVLIYFLTVAILPAFSEEFAFRGVMMGALRPYSEALALLVSSAAFALMHGNFVQLPFTFCCGLVFGYLDLKTNSLLPSIIVHFLNNGLSVLSDVLVSYDILNDYTANLCYGAIFLITGVLALIFIRTIVRTRPDFFRLGGGNDRIPFKEKMKTVASSPSLISYAAVMLLYCIYVMTL